MKETVLQAAMRLSAVDGTAFFDAGVADILTDHIGERLYIRDSAGKTIWGWIKAAGTGETLGSEVHTGWTNVDFSAFTSAGLDITEMVSSGAGNNCYGDGSLTAGALYSLGFTASKDANGYFRLGSTTGVFDGIQIKGIVSGANAAYFTGDETYSGFWAAGAFTDTQISDFTLKPVLTPSSTGVTIVSTEGGSTYNWASKDAGFNYNDTTYEISTELFTDIPKAQSDALQALYLATTGASWTDNTGWGGATAADAYGVTVAGGVVTALDLRANNLDGEFTAAVVAALDSCATIHVEGNPNLNVSFDLDDLPASVTELHCSDTDSSMGGGASAMSAVAIEKILARRASLSSGNVADIVDRVYADRANFTHAAPKLDIGNTYAYGVIWDATADTYQIGVVYNGVFTEQAIDEFPVHEMMRRCVLDDAGVRQYYLLSTDSTKKAANGAAATLDGTDGQVMVELYKFWSIKKHYGTKRYMFVSDGPFSITMPDSSVVTAVIHPVFYAGQATPTERVYCGAYQAAMYDDSASAMMGSVHTNLYAAGDKLCSVSGYYPKTNETIVEFRAAAAARGTGWHQLDAPMWHALQMLYVTKYGTLNSQDAIGMGRTTLSGGVFEAGSYIGICGRSNAVGNASGNQSLGGTAGIPGDYMSFLGVEDFYGNVWQYLDGANVHNSASLGSRLFLCDDYELYASDTDVNYTYAGNLAETDGYVTDCLDVDGFWPVSVGGSNNSYFCDYYHTVFGTVPDSGWRIVLVGGNATFGTRAGAFLVYSDNWSASAYASVGGRLCYTKKET